MLEKGVRPDQPDFAVLPSDPDLGQVQRIGTAQDSIIVVPGRWVGGIGSILLLLLAASGVVRITVVDHDDMEVSKLHWKFMHTEGRRGTRKARSKRDAMRDLNPTLLVTAMTETLTWDNAMELVRSNDFVVDNRNNPCTGYLINYACILAERAPKTASMDT